MKEKRYPLIPKNKQYLKLTVIIPTYNRASSLAETLETLINQTYNHSDFEVLVVDNASTDNTKEVVSSFASKSGGMVRYLYEPRRGSHFARNGAVKHAKGDLLYFTDDDVLAESNMLEELVKTLDIDPEIASVTGPVLAKWLTPPPEWVVNISGKSSLSLIDLPYYLLVSNEDPGIFSCHQLVRKSVLIEAGGYNPDIVNGEWLGDNETGLNIKIRKLGYKFAYTGKAVIHHQIPASRMTQEYLNNRWANQGNSDSYTDYRAKRYSAEELKRINCTFKKKIIKAHLKYRLLKLRGNEQWHMKQALTYYYKNRIRYNDKLIRDASWREMVLKDNWMD